MKKKFIPKKAQNKSAQGGKNIKYRVKDKSRLFEILTTRHGWQPVEILRYTKGGRIVMRLLFSDQIIVRKFGKRMRAYQKR